MPSVLYTQRQRGEQHEKWYWIDFAACIDCSICLQVCPTEGAILDKEEPNLQRKLT